MAKKWKTKIKKNNSIMLNSFENLNLGVWISHGEGKFQLPYNENYYIQTAAYAEMFEEMTGTPINQIVILVVTENGTVQEFIKDKQEYIPLLEETLEEWYQS